MKGRCYEWDLVLRFLLLQPNRDRLFESGTTPAIPAIMFDVRFQILKLQVCGDGYALDKLFVSLIPKSMDFSEEKSKRLGSELTLQLLYFRLRIGSISAVRWFLYIRSCRELRNARRTWARLRNTMSSECRRLR